MAPLPRLSSSEAPPHNAKESVLAPTSFPCSCLLSTALRHFQHKTPLKMPQLPGATFLHPDIVSAAERCVRELSSALAEHPFLKPVFRLHFNFQRFCQTNCMNPSRQNSLSVHNFAAILPGDSMAGLVVANGLTNFLNLYNTVLIVRLVLTWFPGAPPAIVSPLSTICDPYLNIFRGIIPPLGGTLDLSPILAFLVLNFFTSTAAALPAELPTSVTSQHNIPLARQMPLNVTTIQQKWAKRVLCNQGRKEMRMED